MTLPTIFDWLNYAAPLQGYPAVIVVAITAAFIVLFLDWRLALFALMLQYLVTTLLFVDLLDPRLAIIKMLTGMFVCLILYFTARQIDYGRPPQDVAPEEIERLGRGEKRVAVGRWQLRRSLVINLLAILLVLALIGMVTQFTAFRLPGLPPALPHINTAVLVLMALGLVGLITSRDILPAGMALFTFLSGFELYYAALDQSIPTLAGFAALDLALALVIAFLAQVLHKATLALIDD